MSALSKLIVFQLGIILTLGNNPQALFAATEPAHAREQYFLVALLSKSL